MDKDCSGYYGTGSSYTYYPYVYDCSKYVWCVDGRVTDTITCSENYYFDPYYEHTSLACRKVTDPEALCPPLPTGKFNYSLYSQCASL